MSRGACGACGVCGGWPIAALRVEIAIVPIKRNDRTHADDVAYDMGHGIPQFSDTAVLLARAVHPSAKSGL